MNLTLVAGARPNFMKIAPIVHALKKEQKLGRNIQFRIVHTGQHYDHKMSTTFFHDLNIPEPDINLGCGGGSQAEQTAAIMVSFEKYLLGHPSDLVIVVGDVTSTMACSIVAKKLNTKVAHIEAGIRSWDLTMPEEINRMVTDALADYFFTTSDFANKNLRNIGISEDRIYFVGNVMIDTLLANKSRFKKPAIWDEIKLSKCNYLVMTLHRPANVDEESKFKDMLDEIIKGSRNLPIIFPVHPRTFKIISEIFTFVDKQFIRTDRETNNKLNIDDIIFQDATNTEEIISKPLLPQNLYLIDPLGYLEFNYLVENALAVITDSGGITEETTVMGIPCITLRDNTERPETVELGTNELVGTKPINIKPTLDKLFLGTWKKGSVPILWDGYTADRIVSILIKLFL